MELLDSLLFQTFCRFAAVFQILFHDPVWVKQQPHFPLLLGCAFKLKDTLVNPKGNEMLSHPEPVL